MDDLRMGGGFNRDDDELDELIRADLARALTPVDDAGQILEALGPAFKRARRFRRAQIMAVSAVTAVVLLGGIGLVTQIDRLPQRDLTVAGEPDDVLEERPPLDVTDTSVNEGVTEELLTPDTAGDGDPAGGEPQNESGRTVTTVPSSTSSGPTTAESGTSATSGSTNPSSSEASRTTVDSPCGSIVVSLVGSSIRLDEVDPNPGFDQEIKSDGPDSIEVSFEGPGDHCELKAKIEGDRLETSVESED